MGERYSKVADAARMDPMPMDKQLDYVFAMLSEQEKLEIREAYYEDGFEAGVEKGEKQGVVKGKIQMAQAMLKDGVLPETVAKYSGLSIEQLTNQL